MWVANYFLSLFSVIWWCVWKQLKGKVVIIPSKMLLFCTHSMQTQGWHFLIKRFLKLCTSSWEVCKTQTPSLPRWKNSLFFSPTIVPMFLPLLIQITELFHLISAGCWSTAETLRSRKCTSTSKHEIQFWPPHPPHHILCHPKTNKHREQWGIHHCCFCFDNWLCFSITIISHELDKGSRRGWQMETQWIWFSSKKKEEKRFSCSVANDSRVQKLQAVLDCILILYSHFSAALSMEPVGIVRTPWYGNAFRWKRKKSERYL